MGSFNKTPFSTKNFVTFVFVIHLHYNGDLVDFGGALKSLGFTS